MMEAMRTTRASKRTVSTRPTIVIELPTGWGRAAAAGLLAAFFGWVVPVAVAVTGFWVLADDPWLRQQTWQDAVDAGASFWALSLGSPALLGQVSVALIPLLWTLAQILALRIFLGRMDRFSPNSVWAAIPAFVLLAVPLAFSTGRGTTWWKVVLGATILALVAVVWVYLVNLRSVPGWMEKLKPVAAGALAGMFYLFLLGLTGLGAVLLSWWNRREAVQEVVAALHATGADGVALWILQLSYLPLAAAWAVSWLAGTGFHGVGGQLITPAEPPQTGIGLPAWQIIPTTAGTAPWWIFLLLGICLAALTWLLLRRRSLLTAAAVSTSAALVGIAGAALWMLLSTGNLGDGALSELGPPVLPATLRFALIFFFPAGILPIAFHPAVLARLRAFFGSAAEPVSRDDPSLSESPAVDAGEPAGTQIDSADEIPADMSEGAPDEQE